MSEGTDFFAALVRYQIALWNALDAALQQAHGVSLGRFQALRVLRERGGNGRVQDVAGDLAITIGAASKLVDRLERDGTARREPNPNDRRSSLIALTPEGGRVHEAASATFEAALRANLPAELVNASELSALTAMLLRLHRQLQTRARTRTTA
ncbi:MAG: MarR family transcriptional regulator [Propionicimonas sp.]